VGQGPLTKKKKKKKKDGRSQTLEGGQSSLVGEENKKGGGKSTAVHRAGRKGWKRKPHVKRGKEGRMSTETWPQKRPGPGKGGRKRGQKKEESPVDSHGPGEKDKGVSGNLY